MARIAHIALLTKDTEKLAEFYKTSFGMKEVARSGEGGEHGRAIYVSDGHINLAILPARNRREGIYHFGIAVDDVKGAAPPSYQETDDSLKPSCSIRSAPASICRPGGKCRRDQLTLSTTSLAYRS
jgi:catechol 2,3-dioxygenase-like lactoylglutathione lyase family enzyme